MGAEHTKPLSPFYGALERIADALDRDVCFRQSWCEFIAAHPQDRAAEVVSVLLPLERRAAPPQPDPRFRWKW